MARVLLFLVLSIILSRMFWRVAASFMEGLTGVQRRPSASPPQHGVHMVRDPVCGTFVVPDRAVVLACTEIGLLVGRDDSPIPVIDSAHAHARAAAAFALEPALVG